MLWRVRATLPDRPGALAALATTCGGEGVNILGLQVFAGPGAVGDVTDELVVRTPDDWDASDLAGLVERSGGRGAVATRCTHEALADQPTRYVEAARSVLGQPASFPDVLAHLFDADTGPSEATDDVMELTVGDVQVQIRREAPFTGVELERGAALAGLVGDVLGRGRAAAPPSGDRRAGAGGLEYVVADRTVTALSDGVAVGRASVAPSEHDPASFGIVLEVDPDWRHRGIGTRLLTDAARVARAAGAGEVVLTTAHDNRAVMPMVLAAGMRGRIRMSGETLTVRVSV